jgi:Fe-S cluster assembly ATP-binding protein
MNMALLEIDNLHARIGDTPILKGLSLTIEPGTIHAIMGPNGAGKSTLAAVLTGHPAYVVTAGSVRLDGTAITDLSPDQRAQAGLFLAFQSPIDIPGVAITNFLKQAINAQRKARGEEEMPAAEMLTKLRTTAKALGFTPDMLKREVNVGFSGGERKRFEVLQMALLAPKLAILDETDSGLDVDALKAVAEGVNSLRSPSRGFLMITHFQRLLEAIPPDYIHILVDGRIVTTGPASLAQQIEAQGYAAFLGERE